MIYDGIQNFTYSFDNIYFNIPMMHSKAKVIYQTSSFSFSLNLSMTLKISTKYFRERIELKIHFINYSKRKTFEPNLT